MQCKNCESTIQPTDLFCENCGAKLKNLEGEMKVNNEIKHATQEVSSTLAQSDYVGKAKAVSLGYIDFFKMVFRNPFMAAKKADETKFIPALISIILSSVIIPFIIYIMLKDAINLLITFSGGGFGELYQDAMGQGPTATVTAGDILPISTFIIKPFFVILLLQFVIIGLIYLFVKKSKVTFKDTVAKYGTFITTLLTIFIISLIFAFISFKISLFILGVGITCLLFVMPLTLSIYKLKNSSIIDPLIGSLIIYIVIILSEYIYIQSVMKQLLFKLNELGGSDFNFLSNFIGL